jgi:hypothetical protein
MTRAICYEVQLHPFICLNALMLGVDLINHNRSHCMVERRISTSSYCDKHWNCVERLWPANLIYVTAAVAEAKSVRWPCNPNLKPELSDAADDAHAAHVDAGYLLFGSASVASIYSASDDTVVVADEYSQRIIHESNRFAEFDREESILLWKTTRYFLTFDGLGEIFKQIDIYC